MKQSKPTNPPGIPVKPTNPPGIPVKTISLTPWQLEYLAQLVEIDLIWMGECMTTQEYEERDELREYLERKKEGK